MEELHLLRIHERPCRQLSADLVATRVEEGQRDPSAILRRHRPAQLVVGHDEDGQRGPGGVLGRERPAQPVVSHVEIPHPNCR